MDYAKGMFCKILWEAASAKLCRNVNKIQEIILRQKLNVLLTFFLNLILPFLVHAGWGTTCYWLPPHFTQTFTTARGWELWLTHCSVSNMFWSCSCFHFSALRALHHSDANSCALLLKCPQKGPRSRGSLKDFSLLLCWPSEKALKTLLESIEEAFAGHVRSKTRSPARASPVLC